MTRREGREATESRSGMGEDERQPEMVRLANRVKAFQFGNIGNA